MPTAGTALFHREVFLTPHRPDLPSLPPDLERPGAPPESERFVTSAGAGADFVVYNTERVVFVLHPQKREKEKNRRWSLGPDACVGCRPRQGKPGE